MPPFNGSGTFTLPGAALVDGQTISATEHNTLRNDMAAAFTTCVTRDGQSPATANLPMGGFKLTGLAAGTGNGESVRFEQLIATAIVNTPAGNIAATDVQAAINELDTEKAALSGATFTGPVNEAYSTVASHATTADIWSASNTINWTGTATTTAFPNAPQAGATRDLICAAACSFTFGANMTSPHFASGYTYTAQAGERVRVTAVTTNSFRVETFPRSNTYTPSLTNGANVAASTAYACQWMQVGKVCTVSGQVDIDPTSASVATVLSMSLPVASNISANSQVGGTFNYGNANDGGAIYGAAVTDTADFVFVPLSTANRAFFFSFTYLVR